LKAQPNVSRLSVEERWRRAHTPEALAAKAEERRRDLAAPGPEYWERLWMTPHGEMQTRLPCDPVANDRRFVKFQRERGCRCALDRRIGGCGELPRAVSGSSAQDHQPEQIRHRADDRDAGRP
jgi:hypothetical protein